MTPKTNWTEPLLGLRRRHDSHRSDPLFTFSSPAWAHPLAVHTRERLLAIFRIAQGDSAATVCRELQRDHHTVLKWALTFLGRPLRLGLQASGSLPLVRSPSSVDVVENRVLWRLFPTSKKHQRSGSARQSGRRRRHQADRSVTTPQHSCFCLLRFAGPSAPSALVLATSPERLCNCSIRQAILAFSRRSNSVRQLAVVSAEDGPLLDFPTRWGESLLLPTWKAPFRAAIPHRGRRDTNEAFELRDQPARRIIVIWDNSVTTTQTGPHRGSQLGIELRFLPPYSPDLMPSSALVGEQQLASASPPS